MKIKITGCVTGLTCMFTDKKANSFFQHEITNTGFPIDSSILVDGELPDSILFPKGKEVAQKLFNMSLEHVRKQGCQSINPKNNQCVYKFNRNGVDIGCAAAPFILEYKDGMNECGGWYSLIKAPEFIPCLMEDAVDNKFLVHCLQLCHDNSSHDNFLTSYESKMKILADWFGLEYTAA